MSVRQRDIAQAAGVSVSTVSRVLNGEEARTISAETQQNVLRIARSLGYVRRGRASGSVADKPAVAWLLNSRFEKYNDPFFSEMLSGMEGELGKHGYVVDISLTCQDLTSAEYYEHLVSNPRIRGAVVETPSDSPLAAQIKRDIPNIVCISRNADERITDVDVVCFDAAQGIAKAVDALVGAGHSSILYISGCQRRRRDQGFLGVRINAYLERLRHHGIEPAEELIFMGERWDYTDGHRAICEFQGRENFTAVLAENDKMALGAMRSLHDRGLKIPEDVAVVGFDDIESARYAHPPLTTIRVYKEDIGTLAVRALLERINGLRKVPVKIVTPCDLVVRGSI